MPIAVRLSRETYEKLGDATANELVDFLNAVDAASREQLRELNEANWRRMDARFDALEAKVDAKLDGFRVEMTRGLQDLRGEMVTGLQDLRGETVRGLQDLRGETVDGLQGLRVEMHAFKAELIKWMLLFWIGTAASVAGLIKLLQPQ